MSEKRFKTLTIIIEDDIGTVQTFIRSELSAPQLMDKIFGKTLCKVGIKMSEKRFEVINARWQGKGEAVAFEDIQTNQVYFAENQEECERIVDCLNELVIKCHMLEKENRELNSIKKFAERNGINIFLIEEAFRKCWKDNKKLIEENEQLRKETVFLAYWKRKAMTLLMQVRRLTPRMTDKEVIEFSKELDDE